MVGAVTGLVTLLLALVLGLLIWTAFGVCSTQKASIQPMAINDLKFDAAQRRRHRRGGLHRRSRHSAADGARTRRCAAHGRLVELFPDWNGEQLPLHAYHLSRHLPPAKVRAFVNFLLEHVTSSSGASRSR
jgi:hypothetical protein